MFYYASTTLLEGGGFWNKNSTTGRGRGVLRLRCTIFILRAREVGFKSDILYYVVYGQPHREHLSPKGEFSLGTTRVGPIV